MVNDVLVWVALVLLTSGLLGVSAGLRALAEQNVKTMKLFNKLATLVRDRAQLQDLKMEHILKLTDLANNEREEDSDG